MQVNLRTLLYHIHLLILLLLLPLIPLYYLFFDSLWFPCTIYNLLRLVIISIYLYNLLLYHHQSFSLSTFNTSKKNDVFLSTIHTLILSVPPHLPLYHTTKRMRGMGSARVKCVYNVWIEGKGDSFFLIYIKVG